MFKESSKPSNLDTIFIIVLCSIVLALIIIAIIVTVITRKKRKNRIDEEYVNSLINNLGGKSNISKIDVDGKKLKVSVNDLSIVNLEAIKQLAQSGVFISGNNIKALYKYDADDLKKGLKLYTKE